LFLGSTIEKIHKSLTFTTKQLTVISKILLLLLLILVVTVSSLTNMHALESSEKGAYTDNIRFIQYLDGNTALRDIKAGNILLTEDAIVKLGN